MTRRNHSTGTVEEVRGQFRFRCPNGSGGRYTSPLRYSSYEAAEAELFDFRQQVVRGELVDEKGVTLRQFFDDTFMPRTRRLRRKGTVEMYESRWPRIGAALFADKPLVSITRKEIRQWANRLDVTRPDALLSALKAIFQVAVEEEILAVNPASDVTVEMAQRDDDELRPTPDEAAAILACDAIPAADRLIIAFALGAGLRPGEWRNLELRDVHLGAAVPFVLVQFGSDDRGPTKTGKKRRVPLVGGAPVALRAWLEALPTYAPKNPRGLVFPTHGGHARDASHPFGRRGRPVRASLWHAWLAEAGITRRLTPHSLRHGCATDLLTGAGGTRLEAWQVQTILGHALLTTTLGYTHAGERDLFSLLADRSTNSPRSPEPPRESAAPEEVSETAGEGDSEVVLERANLPRGGLARVPQAENASPWTDRGLIARLAEIAEAGARGEWPPDADLLDLIREIDAAHAEADALRRAVKRGLSGWPRAALAELVRLLGTEDMAAGAAENTR